MTRVSLILRNVAAAMLLGAIVLAPPLYGQSRSPAPVRLALFDSRVVFDSLPERGRAQSEVALAQATARVQLEASKDTLRQAMDEFARLERTLTSREREAMGLHLRARELLLEETVARLEGTIQARLDSLRTPMVERVRAAVRAVRAREGYDVVIDVANDALAIEADRSLDITPLILQELRRPAARAKTR